MIYNGMELGSFFEIPWNSPCYQVLRGINPILQAIFTFSQMYFVFMNARLNIHRFKFLSRFGLAHVVATNLCVWIRTLVKESNKEISIHRVKGGYGVSEDYMVRGESDRHNSRFYGRQHCPSSKCFVQVHLSLQFTVYFSLVPSLPLSVPVLLQLVTTPSAASSAQTPSG